MLASPRLIAAMVRDLGLRWVLFRLGYGLKRKFGWWGLRWPTGAWGDRPLRAWLRPDAPDEAVRSAAWRQDASSRFFFPSGRPPAIRGRGYPEQTAAADGILDGTWVFFGKPTFKVGYPPDWHRNPLTGGEADAKKHWSRIGETGAGDIKLVWEPSRFSAAYLLARAYAATGDERYPAAFWALVEDWAEKNPPNRGPNWMCGQETAFRIMAWCFGLWAFAGSPHTTPERIGSMAAMLARQAERIEANISYALSQGNNHGISEALGLYTVGLLFPELKRAEVWRKRGRKLLEQEGGRQIYSDGAYVQHSVNYHRVMLHDYLWVMRLGELNGDRFPDWLYERIAKATDFLFALTDPATGQVPNYGSNDGALVLPLSSCDYTDFRPTLQAANFLCRRTRLFPPGPWDEMLVWLFGDEALEAPLETRACQPLAAEESGYFTLRGHESWGFIRCARYRGRPSQADQLHLDLWWKGVNVACDPGTLHYTDPGGPWGNVLARTRYHNTVEVAQRDQMTRAGRFLWLDWAQGTVRHRRLGGLLDYLEAEHDGYRRLGAVHRRAVLRLGDAWLVVDDVLGEGRNAARLHWLLADARHVFDESTMRLGLDLAPGRFTVRVWSGTPGRISLVHGGSPGDETRGWCSQYYADKEPALSLALEAEGDLPIRFISLLTPGDPQEVSFASDLARIASEVFTAAITLDPPGGTSILRTVEFVSPDRKESLSPVPGTGCHSTL